MSSPIKNHEPLQPEYIPENFVDREAAQARLQELFSGAVMPNIHIQGPRGSGKTHLTYNFLQNQLDESVNRCYIDCKTNDTQYKALRQLYQAVTREHVRDGFHTSKLQRTIQKRTSETELVVFLDNFEFLQFNNGDDLLYYLTRIPHSQQISIITASSQTQSLGSSLDERTYSSLQPNSVQLEHLTGQETYRVLLDRAQDSLKPNTLHVDALTYIASTTQNLSLGLHWLHYIAQKADGKITETLVQEHQRNAYSSYVDHLLQPLSMHHSKLYEIIQDLSEDRESIQTGDIYQAYQESVDNPLSNRRISDFLKQLELLHLIKTQYFYGGSKGKTREIKLANQDNSL